jgi:transcriptional regulator with PAS, ATPase and Fis domain
MNMDWVNRINVAVTVCDKEGIILFMNEQSASVFQKDGGSALIGKSLLDCHPEPSRSKVLDLLKNPRTNVYTIEKNGKKKMIYQTPWYDAEIFAGLVELSLPLPEDIPHFIRK